MRYFFRGGCAVLICYLDQHGNTICHPFDKRKRPELQIPQASSISADISFNKV